MQPMPFPNQATGFPFRHVARALLALALGAAIAGLLVARGDGGWHALAFALAPDAALLLGIAPGLARGRLHPRAVPLYNALHVFAGPLLLGTVAILWLGAPWLVGALAWAAHVAVDRSLGIGLRTPEGSPRG
jgi:hypothetical protein